MLSFLNKMDKSYYEQLLYSNLIKLTQIIYNLITYQIIKLTKRLVMNNSIAESLLEFRVFNPDLQGDDNDLSHIYRKKMCLYYLVCLILGQITWTSLSIAYYQQKIDVTVLLIGAIFWVALWAIFGLRYKYMHIQQFLVWAQICTHTLMYISARLTHNYHFILCGSSMTVIFFIILELIAYKKIISTKFFFYLYLWYVILFYDDMKKINFSETVRWNMMLIMDFYLLMASIFLIIIMKRFRDLSKPAKWQLLLLFYPWSLLLVFCLAGSLPDNAQSSFKWIYLTIINHGVFLFLMKYIINNKYLLPKVRKDHHQQDQRPKIYQLSDVLLIRQQDHEDLYRQSIRGGRPLADCVLCYDQQSQFCYSNCNHAVVGPNCISSWLTKNLRKCPICRTESNSMFMVQRLQGTTFIIQGEYRFKS